MNTMASRIEGMLMRIQGDFLDTPSLRLTLAQAARRFQLDRRSCEALFAVLVDAGVLARTPGGAYARLFPRTVKAA